MARAQMMVVEDEAVTLRTVGEAALQGDQPPGGVN